MLDIITNTAIIIKGQITALKMVGVNMVFHQAIIKTIRTSTPSNSSANVIEIEPSIPTDLLAVYI